MTDEHIESRLAPICWLSKEYDLAININKINDDELLAQNTHNVHGLVPTIGSEVEVKWSSLFPDLAEDNRRDT